MQEKLVPIEIPPGIVKNGTMYQRAGRWADGNLVRFAEDGTPRAIAGVTALSLSGAAIAGVPRGMSTYSVPGTTALARIQVATASGIYEISHGSTAPHVVTDVTPAAGWTSVTEPVVFDRMANGQGVLCDGSRLLANNALGGGVFHYQVITTSDPVNAIVVTPENFLVVLTDSRKIMWDTQGAFDFTATPSSLNTAGSLTLPGAGKWLAGRRVAGQTLLLSTSDVWALRYVGPPLVYGATLAGVGSGLIAPLAISTDGITAYWMSDRGFYKFDGAIQPLQCDIADEIFGNINPSVRKYIFTMANPARDEIWWFWPSTNASSPDRVAIYNTRLGVWSRGALSRNVGADAGAWPGALITGNQFSTVPLTTDGGTIYGHEATGVLSGAYVESGPVQLDPAGNKRLRVQKWVPDNNQTTVDESLTVYAGEWPKQAEQSQDMLIAAAGGELDVRLPAGRYIRFKQSLSREDSRIGTPRAGVLEAEKR